MSADPVPDSLVAAVLSDIVYHSGNETITSPPGWEEVDSYYDPTTGYYGEAWAKLALDTNGNPIPGSYTEVMQVNRGTVFTDSGPGAPTNVAAFTNQAGINVPGADLANTAIIDNGQTISADEQIVFGHKPNYVISADNFYTQITQLTVNGTTPFANIPIIETGQSLGGATSDSVVADEYRSSGGNISAITFNALPFGRGIDIGLTSALANALPITNYYVGNEQATQGIIGTAFQWITGGTALGTSVQLPDLPVTLSLLDFIQIHDDPAAIAELYSALYTASANSDLYLNPSTEAASTALAWLHARYPNPQYTPPQIQAVFNNEAILPDRPVQDIIPNLNDTVSIVIGGNGSFASAQQVETVSQSQAASPDTYQVFSVTPDSSSGEQSVWETDAYNSSGQVVGITQSKTYTDGSFAVYTYTATRVLQSIYQADTVGGALLQTYSNTGGIIDSAALSANNELSIEQYQGTSQLISDAHVNIGNGIVTGVEENADQSILTEINYGASNVNSGIDIGIVSNANGTLDIVDGGGENGYQLIQFGQGGIADDSISIAESVAGIISITTYIASGGTTSITSVGLSSSVADVVAFTKPDQTLDISVNTPIFDSSSGLSDFAVGDAIDFIDAPNVTASLVQNPNSSILYVAGGWIPLFDEDYSDAFPSAKPDGNGGTLVTLTQGETINISGSATDDGNTFIPFQVSFDFDKNDGDANVTTTPTNIYNLPTVYTSIQAHGTITLGGISGSFSGLEVDDIQYAQQQRIYLEVATQNNIDNLWAITIPDEIYANIEDFNLDSPPDSDLVSIPQITPSNLGEILSLPAVELLMNEGLSYIYSYNGSASTHYELDVTSISDDVACYCRGTMILTEAGEMQVEDLRIGDRIQTRFNGMQPVKWMGRRSYSGRFITGQRDVLPVCIKAGALAANVPVRDLWISPHHAMFLDGVLIEARDLVNGVSIVQAGHVDQVEYFHIEFETHDVIVAEGAWSESFLDDDSRAIFHNAHEYQAFYPGKQPVMARYCAPRLDCGYEVEEIRQRLAARAAAGRGKHEFNFRLPAETRGPKVVIDSQARDRVDLPQMLSASNDAGLDRASSKRRAN